MCYMDRVGIRELRQNLTVYLRRVQRGETLEVTDRGRPVAVIGPLEAALLGAGIRNVQLVESDLWSSGRPSKLRQALPRRRAATPSTPSVPRNDRCRSCWTVPPPS